MRFMIFCYGGTGSELIRRVSISLLKNWDRGRRGASRDDGFRIGFAPQGTSFPGVVSKGAGVVYILNGSSNSTRTIALTLGSGREGESCAGLLFIAQNLLGFAVSWR